jgi:SPX domain protein involved in polyphosphate accumulation
VSHVQIFKNQKEAKINLYGMMKIIVKHDMYMNKPYHVPPSVELQIKNLRAQF